MGRRRQFVLDIIHPEQGSVSKDSLKDKLATLYKAEKERIAIFGMKTKFGGGQSSGYALVYDSVDARKANDLKQLLRRDGLFKEEGKKTINQKKEMKGRCKKVRGKAKAAARDAGGKKKKR